MIFCIFKLDKNFNLFEIFCLQESNSLCGMCSEEYNNQIHLPKILSCNHTFCLDCLTSLAKGFEIKCPLGCPYITILHESGVTGLCAFTQLTPRFRMSLHRITQPKYYSSFTKRHT